MEGHNQEVAQLGNRNIGELGYNKPSKQETETRGYNETNLSMI